MSGFGEKLKREREARHISLEEISAATKISVRLLQAIETENFDRLPGGVFNVNFVRQFARHLGLEEDRIAAEFRNLTAPPTIFQEEQKPVLPAEWSRAPRAEYESGFTREPRLWKWATAVIVLLGVGSASYLWWEDRQSQRAREAAATPRPAPAETPPAVAPAPVAVIPPAVDPAPEAAPETAPETAAQNVAQNPAPAPPAAAPSQPPTDAPVRVELRATDLVWVSASADGAPRFQTMLHPEQTRWVAAKSFVRLRVGNAGGLLVTLNGEALPALGPKGQVRTVVLTPAGMEVVPSQPAATPAGAPADGAAPAGAHTSAE